MAEEKKAVKPKKATTAKAEAKPKAAAKPKTSVKKDAPVKKAAAKPAARKTKASPVNAELRYRMIEVAAYYLAEKDGFAGSPVEYWIAAELQFNK
ncbi:DUF2934 domain-containing protein [Methylotenera sp. G11]|uniref:DUF2934 domain-containing protein n=1 Tax=Methylotenera sp. G11 TaxID=1506585 RepID=UPI00064590B1|nr:DUF2934 domain-containing protein [Methylotenera sp. G11]